MKAIKQLEFKLREKEYEKYGKYIPYAWISFNPDDLEEHSSTILIFNTPDDYMEKIGEVHFISNVMVDKLRFYTCKPLY